MPSLSAIGATALQLTSTSKRCSEIVVKALATNSANVWVGEGSAITAGTTDATDGFELAAGEGISLRNVDPSVIYCISTGGSQKVSWRTQIAAGG